MTPPRAPKRPVSLEAHGETREDPYAWLRVENWTEVMKDPSCLPADVREHLDAENAHAEAWLRPHAAPREGLFEELRGRIKEDDASVPAPDGPWAYYARYETGGQHPVFCRRPRDREDGEVVLLHGDTEAAGRPFWQIAGCEHAPDHRYLAYAVDERGSELYTLRIRDLETGKDLDDRVERASGHFEWAEDSATLFYTVLDDNHRPSRVFRHRVGQAADQDALVYDEPDPGFFVGVGKTESRKYVVIDAHDHQTSEVRLVPAAAPESDPTLVRTREVGVEYSVSHHGDRLLILTNRGDAEDFEIVQAPESGGPWTPFVPHQPGRLITDFAVTEQMLLRLELVDALPRIVLTPLGDRGDEHVIAFDEAAYSLGMHGSYEFDTTLLRFGYSSMTTPARVYDYDMFTRERVLRKEQEVPSGHDPDAYVVERSFATAPDGELVPVSILRKKTTPVDGSAPALLYGYGSYGHTIPAAFGTGRLSLVDRGFVFAIAHIRGGMERGYRWYREGRALRKQNTFHDFIAAAEHLIERGYTRPGRVAAHGGSAGGMLVGAVANLRPDLFGAILAEVPFVDVLNTMSDGSLPLTPPEWPEWGNPLEDEEAYRYIKSYSPYDNVEAKDYPAMMVTAGLTDPRVTYWEPAKWVARLRELKTDDRPLLFKVNMEAGHAGAAGRLERLKETAMLFTFLLAVFDMAGAEGAGEA